MERRKDGRYAEDRGRYKRRILPVSGDKKGTKLIIKGDGSVFQSFNKGYRNHLWRVRCGILRTAFLCGLVRLALPCFPAVHSGYIRIEGTCSPAEAFFVDFKVVNLIGDTFRFVTVFGDTV